MSLVRADPKVGERSLLPMQEIGQHDRDPGKGVEILCVADEQPGHVGQAVAWTRLDQDGGR